MEDIVDEKSNILVVMSSLNSVSVICLKNLRSNPTMLCVFVQTVLLFFQWFRVVVLS